MKDPGDKTSCTVAPESLVEKFKIQFTFSILTTGYPRSFADATFPVPPSCWMSRHVKFLTSTQASIWESTLTGRTLRVSILSISCTHQLIFSES